MKKVLVSSALIAVIGSLSLCAQSIIRVKCVDKNVGAEIYLNEKSVGKCPLDAPTESGIVTLRAHRMVDTKHEQIFLKEMFIEDGIPQRVEVILSETQMTPKAKAYYAASMLQKAQAGDVVAMQEVSGLYESGFGLEKDSEKAGQWRAKAEVEGRNKAERAKQEAINAKQKAINKLFSSTTLLIKSK
jgi:hypothetical protein